MAEFVEDLLTQSPACLWIVKGTPVPDQEPGRYTAITFERVWGRSADIFDRTPEQLIGQRCDHALPESAGVRWPGRFERALAGETLNLRERRGEALWFVTVYPVHAADGSVLAGGIAREVSRWGSAEVQLRHTVLGAMKAQEYERGMMARFLHDNVGQNLTALGLQLDLIRMDLEGGAAGVGDRVAEVQKTLGEIMEAVREYSYELDPATVERAGLRVALDRVAARWRTHYAGTIRINVDPSLKAEPQLARALFQIAQEAAENAIQHAGCTAIDVSARAGRSGAVLEVRDNGRGFDPDDILGGNRGLGMLSMEYYAAQAGLDLSVVSTRGLGTTVRAAQG